MLERELATFERLRQELLQNHRGKFALIMGDDFIDTYDTVANAYEEGITRFGRVPFLVRRILETEEVYRNPDLDSGLIHARI